MHGTHVPYCTLHNTNKKTKRRPSFCRPSFLLEMAQSPFQWHISLYRQNIYLPHTAEKELEGEKESSYNGCFILGGWGGGDQRHQKSFIFFILFVKWCLPVEKQELEANTICLRLWCFSLVNQYHSCQFLGFLFCIKYNLSSSIYLVYGTHFRYNGWLPVQVKYSTI
jgi:hypothetical protein